MKYISVTDTAKMIRQDLKKAFPEIKFGVVSDKYAGGASIRVRWKNGPTQNAVKEIVRLYEGSGFDGSIDMAYSKTVWQLPDGTLQRAHVEGTEGSMGYAPEVNNPKPHPEAVEVRFSADYVFADREIDDEIKTAVGHKVAKEYGAEWDGNAPWDFRVPAAGEYLSTLVHRELVNTTL